MSLATRVFPHSSITEFVDQALIVAEDTDTASLIRRLAPVKHSGSLGRAEFLEICRWKSPRSINFAKRNSAARIQAVSREVLSTRIERGRMELLTTLHGVSIPTASAILTLTNPKRYGVIDIRVWQLLYKLGAVNKNPRGQGFTVEQWLEYLRILREHAKRRRVSVRRLELTLFKVHEENQEGSLY
jgi:thermostable 8-oxoguanine DNA glycosylase